MDKEKSNEELLPFEVLSKIFDETFFKEVSKKDTKENEEKSKKELHERLTEIIVGFVKNGLPIKASGNKVKFYTKEDRLIKITYLNPTFPEDKSKPPFTCKKLTIYYDKKGYRTKVKYYGVLYFEGGNYKYRIEHFRHNQGVTEIKIENIPYKKEVKK